MCSVRASARNAGPAVLGGACGLLVGLGGWIGVAGAAAAVAVASVVSSTLAAALLCALLTGFLPASQIQVAGQQAAAIDLVIAFCSAAMLLRALYRWPRLVVPEWCVAVLMLAVLGGISRAASPEARFGTAGIITVVLATSEIGVMGIAAASALRSAALAARLMWMLLGLGAATTLFYWAAHVAVCGSLAAALALPIHGETPYLTAIADTGAAAFALYVAMHALVLLAAARCRALSRRTRLASWAGAVFMMATVFLTRSRGESLGLLVGVAYILTLGGLRGERARRLGRAREVALLLGTLVAVAFAVTPWASAMAARLTGKTFGSVAARYLMWSSVIPLGIQHPVLGIGPGLLRERLHSVAVDDPAAKVFVSQQSSVHSTYVDAFVERGAAGLLCLLWFFVAAHRKCRRAAAYGDERYSWLPLGVGAVVWAVAVSNLFETELYIRSQGLLAIVLACATVVHTVRAADAQPESTE